MLGKIFLLLIVVFGIAMAVPSTRATMMEKAAPVMNGFKAKLVPGRLAVRVNRGEGYPSSWESWLQRDFRGEPTDPWGNVYYLQTNRRGFTVGSAGPDGVQGNEDDIKATRDLSK